MLRQSTHRLVYRKGLVDLGEGVFAGRGVDRLLGQLLAAARAQLVHAEAAGEGPDPWPHRVVVAQVIQALVRAREHLLEDILGIVLLKPVDPHRDRVHVAGEAVDQLLPGLLVAVSTAGDQVGVGYLGQRHYRLIKP